MTTSRRRRPQIHSLRSKRPPVAVNVCSGKQVALLFSTSPMAWYLDYRGSGVDWAGRLDTLDRRALWDIATRAAGDSPTVYDAESLLVQMRMSQEFGQIWCIGGNRQQTFA